MTTSSTRNSPDSAGSTTTRADVPTSPRFPVDRSESLPAPYCSAHRWICGQDAAHGTSPPSYSGVPGHMPPGPSHVAAAESKTPARHALSDPIGHDPDRARTLRLMVDTVRRHRARGVQPMDELATRNAGTAIYGSHRVSVERCMGARRTARSERLAPARPAAFTASDSRFPGVLCRDEFAPGVPSHWYGTSRS